MQPHRRNAWVPVAIAADLPAGIAMPVETPDGQFALWRSGTGHVAAFADRCPHRGMRLSHGFVRGEALSCIYHGWSYSRTGGCLRIPAHPGLTPPSAIRVASFPVEEAGGLVWIAAEEPGGPPPRLDGLAPLRTLAFAADRGGIEAAAGGAADVDGVIGIVGNSQALRLLVAPQGEARSLVHVLVPRGSDRAAKVAASRNAESLRRMAEAAQRRRAA